LRVESVDKDVYYASFQPSEKPGYVYVRSRSESFLSEISHINSLSPIKSSFLKTINGKISLGFTYSHSSNIGQLSSNISFGMNSRRLNFSLKGSGISSINDSDFSRDREAVDLTTYYNIIEDSRWYALTELNYQRNLELSIARRFQETVGGGAKFVISANAQIMGLVGINFNQERSTEGVNKNMLVEVPLGFVFNYFKFSHPNLQLTTQNVMYTSLSQKGRIRLDSNTSISYELFNNLSLSLNFYANFDNQPPDSGAGKADYGTVASLTYKF
jgi:hypothetical protein